MQYPNVLMHSYTPYCSVLSLCYPSVQKEKGLRRSIVVDGSCGCYSLRSLLGLITRDRIHEGEYTGVITLCYCRFNEPIRRRRYSISQPPPRHKPPSPHPLPSCGHDSTHFRLTQLVNSSLIIPSIACVLLASASLLSPSLPLLHSGYVWLVEWFILRGSGWGLLVGLIWTEYLPDITVSCYFLSGGSV